MVQRRRHVCFISGKDSLATAIVQRNKQPHLPYEYVFNPTGWDLPEMDEWLGRVEKFLGKPITRVGEDLTEKVEELNMLPGIKARFCTYEGKIKPVQRWLSNEGRGVVCYYGLRADEPERVGSVSRYTIPKFPLREANMGVADVWELVQSVGLEPPAFHWQWMEDKVRELITVTALPHLRIYHDRLDAMQPWERRALFAWRSRSNCDRCFFQRQYEWIGLHEHHPDRFEDACKMEEDLIERRPETPFTLLPGKSLRSILDDADRIKLRRANEINGMIRNGPDPNQKRKGLDVISCGLLCGK